MRSALTIPLLLLAANAAGCQGIIERSGTVQAAKVLIKEKLPQMTDALTEDAEARTEATRKVSKILDKIDFYLAGAIAGFAAFASTWGKSIGRALVAYLRRRKRRPARARKK